MTPGDLYFVAGLVAIGGVVLLFVALVLYVFALAARAVNEMLDDR